MDVERGPATARSGSSEASSPIATTESEIIDVFELSPRRVLDET